MKKFAVLALAALAVAPCAQELKVAYTWDTKAGWEEKFVYSVTPWKVEDFLGQKDLDLQPFFWGNALNKAGGVGFYVSRPIARNLSVEIGPMLRWQDESRPSVGVFVGASLKING